jgi:hypothetical protein
MSNRVNDKPYWCAYADFHFSQRQVCWMLENEDYFKQGHWPPEPGGEYLTDRYDRHEKRWVDWTGTGGIPVEDLGRPPLKCEAAFCKAAEVYGEVMRRIEYAGKDGRLLLAQIRAGYELLDDDAQHALAYASGFKRKLSKYEEWRGQRRRRGVLSGQGFSR